jgi:ABC-type sugar transport system ATPase subunit
VIGIRPEHLHLHLAGGAARDAGGPSADGAGSASGSPDAGRAELAGEVLLVEELGADALLHVRLAGSGNQVVARAEGRRPPAPGQEVTFRVQPDDVFAFHPVTGARLAG